MSAVLSIKDLRKNFSKIEVTRGLDLDVEEGERHAIIGPNGAGKSTLFQLISGRLSVTDGSIRLRGREIANKQPFEIVRMGLGRSFQVTNIFPRMTVYENIQVSVLWVAGARLSVTRLISQFRDVRERTEEILERIGLVRKRDVLAGLLSYADQRALEIGITLGPNPDVILLDEPTAGMSNTETRRAVELIRHVSEGKTLIIVEHDMSVVFDLADRISVLVYGQIIATDTPDGIRKNKTVQEAYLGGMGE
jgi:branched-chain amino acid transport system ATP-binding protein